MKKITLLKILAILAILLFTTLDVQLSLSNGYVKLSYSFTPEQARQRVGLIRRVIKT
jgi:hypothetical protein